MNVPEECQAQARALTGKASEDVTLARTLHLTASESVANAKSSVKEALQRVDDKHESVLVNGENTQVGGNGIVLIVIVLHTCLTSS